MTDTCALCDERSSDIRRPPHLPGNRWLCPSCAERVHVADSALVQFKIPAGRYVERFTHVAFSMLNAIGDSIMAIDADDHPMWARLHVASLAQINSAALLAQLARRGGDPLLVRLAWGYACASLEYARAAALDEIPEALDRGARNDAELLVDEADFFTQMLREVRGHSAGSAAVREWRLRLYEHWDRG